MRQTSAIVLASASPRRRELLERAGVTFTVVPSTTDETLLPGEDAESHVLRLSRDKAREVASRPGQEGRWFIGSDTVVVRDGTILGKPGDATEAATMLTSLSGRSHRVVSGFAIYDRQSDTCRDGAVSTRVWFRTLTDREIEGYIASGEPMDKAGAYAIQGLASSFIPRIEGSYTNVVGLPLCEVLDALTATGAFTPFS